MALILAFIHRHDESFGISFPDFPGAISGGGSAEEALERGKATLLSHIEALQEEGLPIPAPKQLTGVDMRWTEYTPDLVSVGAIEIDLPGKAAKVTFTIDENLLGRIDRAAEAAGQTRSGFIAAAARARLSG